MDIIPTVVVAGVGKVLVPYRFRLFRFLNIPVPNVERLVPIIGGKTIPELTLLFVTVVVLLSVGFAVQPVTTGALADAVCCLIVLFSSRSSPVTEVMSTDRTIFWHKAMGVILLSLLLIHSIGVGLSRSGVVLAVCFFSMALGYILHRLVGTSYNWFYFPHVLCFVVVVPAAFVHGAICTGVMGLCWMVTLFLRYYFRLHETSAKASLIGDHIVKLDVPVAHMRTKNKQFTFQPAQFVYLQIRDVSKSEFHPFSIASAPVSNQEGMSFKSDATFSIYIKRSGDWTDRLYRNILRKVKRESRPTITCTQSVAIEGPYGNLTVDVFDRALYQNIVLCAGGVGITAFLSLLEPLLNVHCHTTPSITSRITLIWTVNDIAFAEHIYQDVLSPLLHRQLSGNRHEEGEDSPVAHAATASGIIAEYDVESPLHRIVHNQLRAKKGLTLLLYYTGSGPLPSSTSSSATSLASADAATKTVQSDPTAVERDAERRQDRDSLLWQRGRPPLARLLPQLITSANSDDDTVDGMHVSATASSKKTKTDKSQNGTSNTQQQKRVAVLVSGPEILREQVRDLCDQTSYYAFEEGLYRQRRIRVDCHEESFGF